MPVAEPIPDADRRLLSTPTGPVMLYEAGSERDGEPVLLVHSVNAAASAYEMRPLFQSYRDRRPTYALDLPGYGQSARLRTEYTPETMSAAIEEALDATGPAHVVALSLGSEFAARVAITRPADVLSLTVISPTGLSSRTATPEAGFVEAYFAAPLVGRATFDLLTTRTSIRWFLGKSFTGDPDPGLVDHAYASAHQPGAEYAPAAFLSGRLFSPDALDALYAEVACPMLVLHDTDPYTDFARLPDLVERGSDVTVVRIPDTRGLPHFERLPAVVEALDTFWNP